MKALLTLALCLVISGCSTAREAAPGPQPVGSEAGHLVIRVRSGEAGEHLPISGARVLISETGQSALTDERGLASFRLPVYIAGRPAYYTLSVTMPGFITETYQDVHAFEGDPVGSTVTDVYLVHGQGELVHQIPRLGTE